MLDLLNIIKERIEQDDLFEQEKRKLELKVERLCKRIYDKTNKHKKDNNVTRKKCPHIMIRTNNASSREITLYCPICKTYYNYSPKTRIISYYGPLIPEGKLANYDKIPIIYLEENYYNVLKDGEIKIFQYFFDLHYGKTVFNSEMKITDKIQKVLDETIAKISEM